MFPRRRRYFFPALRSKTRSPLKARQTLTIFTTRVKRNIPKIFRRRAIDGKRRKIRRLYRDATRFRPQSPRRVQPPRSPNRPRFPRSFACPRRRSINESKFATRSTSSIWSSDTSRCVGRERTSSGAVLGTTTRARVCRSIRSVKRSSVGFATSAATFFRSL